MSFSQWMKRGLDIQMFLQTESFHNGLKPKLSKINHPEKVKSDVSYILSHFNGGMLCHGDTKRNTATLL